VKCVSMKSPKPNAISQPRTVFDEERRIVRIQAVDLHAERPFAKVRVVRRSQLRGQDARWYLTSSEFEVSVYSQTRVSMAFSEETVQAVWGKGRIVTGHSADQWRQDECGAWMGREFYENRDTPFGWEIGRIVPTGADDLSNLRPLQWKNHADEIDGRLKCYVTAVGSDNVDSSL